jgi:alkanesulfonate monooxygenase SsuD/methylene tetrahydromethanopterin reductase-like flavin-dependent oxidoreductase (luciferase family)
VARHADVWNHTSSDPERSARLSRVLDEHCAAVGRDPREIGRSAQFFYTGARDAFLRLAEGLARKGFTRLVCGVRNPGDGEVVAELLPSLRALE